MDSVERLFATITAAGLIGLVVSVGWLVFFH